ncbi:MAG: FtsW/RodA/SpoVE family cell cycle protein, partial [Bacteroidales bacterium]|nr:FtsW/RodA/SpoVE family cell cycle protein [Bacteroidales bacterium]
IILLIRAGRIASACKRNFPSFLVMGLAMLLVSQAFLNMLVAVGLFPVTGQTLPMISRGGTSTLITCVYFGMILSVSTYAEKEKAKAKAEREATSAPSKPVATMTVVSAAPAEAE